jgi:hypothetical protein
MANNQSATVLLRAYTLAKAKRYSEAEALILSDSEVVKTPPAIDLLARLRFEQKDLIEARRLWEELLSTYPHYSPARRALKHFDRKSRWLTLGRLTVFIIVLLALLCVGLGMYVQSLRAPTPTPLEAPLAPSTPITYTWETLPRYVDLQALSPHRGKIKRILLSSHLFADPKATARRQNLIESFTYALGLEPQQIFFAEASASDPQERLTLIIETL